MTEYYIHKTGTHKFCVAKFEPGETQPTDTYDIVIGGRQDSCNCPSRKFPCKHMLMVNEWFQQENPERFYYDDSQQKWCAYPKHLITPITEDQVIRIARQGKSSRND